MVISLTPEFEASCADNQNYPINLVYKSASLFKLRSFKTQLDEASTNLFSTSDPGADVRFLDSAPQQTPGTQAGPRNHDFQEFIINGDATLRGHLGNTISRDPQTGTRTGHLATKEDPICRFIFIWAAHSRAKLKITRLMLARILSYFQVMQGYLHFVSVFGQQSLPYNTRFSGFRSETVISAPAPGCEMPDLKRSGRQYQLCYNLKSVACTSPVTEPTRTKQWSIRQVAPYHRFDVVFGTALWLITKGDLLMEEYIRDLVGPQGRLQDRSFGSPSECFVSSLAVHLLFVSWAAEGWTAYLRWLEEVVDSETKIAVIGPRGFGDGRREYKPEDLQRVQQFEEKANEATMVLEGNIDVLTSLRGYYEELLHHRDFDLKASCAQEIGTFATQVNDAVYETRMHVSRAKLLLRIISDRKSLVLQHLQTQAAEKMEIMTVLAQKEAIAMRVITVVTLIYLPATFVSVSDWPRKGIKPCVNHMCRPFSAPTL
ncbi:hypothetical protein CLAIMM_09404 isoform 1 [Cladophialophora immunda]|nr:hypothetical protein CLAIMM_09404 isoform 1 [Cladophialophora immunda]